MSDDSLHNQVEKLEKQKKQLQAELRRLKRKPQGKIGYLLLTLGLILLSLAVYYTHNVSAFIGIALTFWGALLLYIRPTQFIRKEILDSTTIETLKFQHKLLDELGYNGTPTYISAGTLAGLRSATVYIPKTDPLDQLTYENLPQEQTITESNPAIKITPPGLGLHRLIEDELKTNFSIADPEHLQYNLEKAIVEGLEIAESFEMEISNTTIQVNIKGNIFNETIAELDEHRKIGDPLTSALACILTRSTHQPITIEQIHAELKKKSTQIVFKIGASMNDDANEDNQSMIT